MKGRDPLQRYRGQLVEAGLLDDAAEAEIVAEAKKVVEDATEWAEEQSDPDPATAQRHVYASAPPARVDDVLWQSERFMGDGGPIDDPDAPAAGGHGAAGGEHGAAGGEHGAAGEG